MAKCCWCKKSGLFLSVNRYGFCKPCSDQLRRLIGGKLAKIGEVAKGAESAQDRETLQAMAPQLREAIKTIRELEQLRPSVPFFRSDTSEYAKIITQGLYRAAGKEAIPQAQRKEGGALEKAMAHVLAAETQVGRREKGADSAECELLEFPLAVEDQVPAYLYGEVAFEPSAGQVERGLPGGRVLLEQDPQSGDDPDTVRVYQGGRELGCLPPGPERKLVNRWLDGEKPVLARLSPGQEAAETMEICFYDQTKKSGFRFFPLAPDPEAVENLLAAGRWERVSFRWEEQAGRYAVQGQAGQVLGFLPGEAEALLEGGEPFAFLYQVQKTDSGQPAAKVAIARPRRRWLG